MSLSVQQRGRAIATFRYIEVRLMELTALWTPSTPEMEVKVMFGRHIYDFARHADQLGKRTFELRLPEQHSLRAAEPYVQLLDAADLVKGTGERLATMYDAILPGLIRRYETYIRETDPILDEPSLVILENIARDLHRQRAEADALRGEIGVARRDATVFLARDGAIDQIVTTA